MPFIHQTNIPSSAIKQLVSEGIARSTVIDRLWKKHEPTWKRVHQLIKDEKREQKRLNASIKQMSKEIEKTLEPVA